MLTVVNQSYCKVYRSNMKFNVTVLLPWGQSSEHGNITVPVYLPQFRTLRYLGVNCKFMSIKISGILIGSSSGLVAYVGVIISLLDFDKTIFLYMRFILIWVSYQITTWVQFLKDVSFNCLVSSKFNCSELFCIRCLGHNENKTQF